MLSVATTVATLTLLLLGAAAAAAAAADGGDGPFGAATDCAMRGLMLRYAQVLQVRAFYERPQSTAALRRSS